MRKNQHPKTKINTNTIGCMKISRERKEVYFLISLKQNNNFSCETSFCQNPSWLPPGLRRMDMWENGCSK